MSLTILIQNDQSQSNVTKKEESLFVQFVIETPPPLISRLPKDINIYFKITDLKNNNHLLEEKP